MVVVAGADAVGACVRVRVCAALRRRTTHPPVRRSSQLGDEMKCRIHLSANSPPFSSLVCCDGGGVDVVGVGGGGSTV